MPRQLPARPSLENLQKQAKSLHKAHRAAVPDALARIREHHPHWRNTPAPDRFTLADAQLVVAREYGFADWAALKMHVLSHQPNAVTEESIRSLQDAAGQGDLTRLGALLDANPELIDETAGPGVRTALHHAVFGSSEAGVRFLLERGANPNIRCEGDNAYPLHFAVEKQLFPIVRLLIEHDADPIGEGDYHELGVLGWATAWESIQPDGELVDYLLAHGARHNIFSAVSMGDLHAIAEIVARSPADLEKRMDVTNRRRRALHLAVIKRQPKAVGTLLDLGANPESLDVSNFTPLDQAALIGDADIARIFLDRGAKVRLPAAITLGQTADIERLLARDPDALKPGCRWDRLILRAAERASGSVIDALVNAGASVNIPDNTISAVDLTSGYTPLHAAAWHGNLSAAAALIRYGANVRTREEKWHGTPAGWANYAGYTEVRDLILKEPVDMMEAVENGLTQRVAAILQEDPEALNRPFRDYPLYPLYAAGWHTPLAFAIMRDKTDIVRFLLERGADVEVRSPEGRTLFEIAQELGRQEIVCMLKDRAP